MKRGDLFPIQQLPTDEEHKALGFNASDWTLGLARHQCRAEYTGELRPPKAGEWYLSGAVIEGYRAPNDLTQSYHIASLVRVRTETAVTTVERVTHRINHHH